jgi:stage II sporulation protein M
MKKRKKKQTMFKESISYLKESMIYFWIIVGLFLFSALIGFMFPENFVFFDELLKELAEKTTGLGHGELTWFIFQNNILSSFIGLAFGIVLGVFPLMGTLINGLLLGYVYAQASAVAGLGVIWMLIPHGIFELPAVFISFGLGLKLGMFIFTKNKKKELIERLIKSLKVFFSIVLPLLIIAAIIEGILIFSF